MKLSKIVLIVSLAIISASIFDGAYHSWKYSKKAESYHQKAVENSRRIIQLEELELKYGFYNEPQYREDLSRLEKERKRLLELSDSEDKKSSREMKKALSFGLSELIF